MVDTLRISPTNSEALPSVGKRAYDVGYVTKKLARPARLFDIYFQTISLCPFCPAMALLSNFSHA